MPGFSGQGIVSIAPRLPSGLPGVFRDLGNASIFKPELNQETVERNESRSGSRLPFRRLTKAQGGKLSVVGDEWNKENFALATLGTTTSVAVGSAVVGYALPNPLKVGDTVIIPAKNATGVTVKDSTGGAAKVLTKDTNYSFDVFSGEITILDLTVGGAYVQPLKAGFTPGAYDVVGAFTAPSAEYFVRLKGVNTDDANKRVICDVFRVRFSPTQALDLISNDYLDFNFDATMLYDPLRDAADPEGQFFSVAFDD